MFKSSPASKSFTITVEHGASAVGYADERVLVSLERMVGRVNGAGLYAPGVIPVGCRRGGCGVCRSRVIAGAYECCAMSRLHVSDADRREGIVLACSIFPRSDLVLRPEPKRADIRADKTKTND